MSEPLTPDTDGRRQNGADHDKSGRFTPGNRASTGNAAARKAATFRAKLFAAVHHADFVEVARRLLQEAKAGKPWAVKLLLAYLIGPAESEMVEVNLNTGPTPPIDFASARAQLLADNALLAEWEADALEQVQRERAAANGDGKPSD